MEFCGIFLLFLMVGRVRFELTKPKRLIYSQVVLATYLPTHLLVPPAGLEPTIHRLRVDCFLQFSQGGIWYTLGESNPP